MNTYQFQCYRQIDVVRFVTLIEEANATLLQVLLSGPYLNHRYLIAYQHTEELDMMVHT